MNGGLAARLTGGCLAGWLCAGASAEPMSLEHVVRQLSVAGESVYYSEDLVAPDTLVDVSAPTLSNLQRALSTLGLDLVTAGDRWVIAPLATAPLAVYVRSGAGTPLDHVTVAGPAGAPRDLQRRADGAYAVEAAAGETVTIAARQHQPWTGTLTEGQTVVLRPAAIVEEVIVTGTLHRLMGRAGGGSRITLSGEDLESVPALGGDAMRATAQLPGMATMGVSAKPWIRGGLQDELLIRLDGVELLDAYHLADFQSVFSVVDDRSVSSVDVYTGAFPARYGNRMSGVMEIVTDGGDAVPGTELGVSLFSLLASHTGVSDDGRTRYLATLRRGNLDYALDLLDDASLGTPRYHDAYGRVRRQLSDDAAVAAGVLLSRDDITLQEDETVARSSIDSRYAWTRLSIRHGAGLSSESTLAYTWSRRGKHQQDLDDDSGAGGFLDHHEALWNLDWRTDFHWRGPGRQVEFGAGLRFGEARIDSRSLVERGLISELLGRGSVTAHDIEVAPDGWAGGVYLALDQEFGTRWLIQPGLRWDVQRLDGRGSRHLSPRLGLRFRASEVLTLRLDGGRFHQPQAVHELQAADGKAAFFPPQRADHYIAGADWLLRGDWELTTEVYLKHYDQLRPRYENAFNPFVLVPEIEPDRVRLAPRRARARGADLQLAGRLGPYAAIDLNYSYLDAEDRFEDWVPRRWSQRHTARALFSWSAARWQASVAATWHSGWRGAALPESVPAEDAVATADVLRSAELKSYFTLDVGVRRWWQWADTRVTVSASVSNLTDRRNLAGIEYDAEQDGGEVTFERQVEPVLPRVPSVGLLITF